MAHAIIREANGRRHEIDFDGAEVAVEIFCGEDNVEISVESPHDLAPAEKQRFALLNVSRELFN